MSQEREQLQGPLCSRLGLCILPPGQSSGGREVLRCQFSSLPAPLPPGARITLPQSEGISFWPPSIQKVIQIIIKENVPKLYFFTKMTENHQGGSGLQSSIGCVIPWPRGRPCFGKLVQLLSDGLEARVQLSLFLIQCHGVEGDSQTPHRHPLDGATGIAHVDLKWSGYRERDSIDVLRGRSCQSQGKETSERQGQGRTETNDGEIRVSYYQMPEKLRLRLRMRRRPLD